MESTAQYWRPVWEALERQWQPQRRRREGAGPVSGTLHLAQAQSNQGPRGRKKDFPDAERLVKRLVAQELTLSFVPEALQRLWRIVTRRKYQVTCNRVQLQNRLECLLEEAHIKVSSLVSDSFGPSARRMLRAVADGATDPAAVVALASQRLRATPEQLCDALGACTDLHPVYRRLPPDELRCSTSRFVNSIRNWQICSRRIKTPCNAWPPCRAWASIRRNKSSPRSGRLLQPFLLPSGSHRGWGRVQVTMRAPG